MKVTMRRLFVKALISFRRSSFMCKAWEILFFLPHSWKLTFSIKKVICSVKCLVKDCVLKCSMTSLNDLFWDGQFFWWTLSLRILKILRRNKFSLVMLSLLLVIVYHWRLQWQWLLNSHTLGHTFH
jgi:hypothetical protein